MKLSYPSFNKTTLKKVHKVLQSGRVNYWTGNECKEFEKEFSNYIGNKYAVALSNGSVALELALSVLKFKKGDEIIVSPRSFIISASCVLRLGLKPVFADIDKNGNLSIEGIEEVYNKKVKAIIVVHLNGLSCNLDPILNFVKKKKLFLIEDCSQAHGAVYKGKKVGAFGHISTWSFCQDKIISTGGEGGMISTNNRRYWLKLWSLKDHGKNFNDVFHKKHKIGYRWLHDELGSNFRMTEMQAVIGREQLKSLDKQIKQRNIIANLYLTGLKDYYQKYKILKKPDFNYSTSALKQVKKSNNKSVHAFYRLNLFINNKNIKQSKLLEQLNNSNVNCGVGSCPEIYREKIFKKKMISLKKRLSNAKLLGETSLTIPINPYRSLINIRSEIKSIKKVLNKYL
tara:strand:+ start:316 stop:1512 length:1197 start_codon:yes stop_codon:yes gene_type:complete